MMKLNFHDKEEKLELAIYHRKIFLLEILKSSEARENENCPFRVEVFLLHCAGNRVKKFY